MNSSINIFKRLLSCTCVVLALLLLTPTFVSLLSLVHPETSISLVMENPLEEEREEERSSGEEDLKELKEFTLPAELMNKDAYSMILSIRHQYVLSVYSSVFSVPDLPPEFLG
jgi:hypothetical protein